MTEIIDIPKTNGTRMMQNPYRGVLHPDKEQEMDQDYVEGTGPDLAGPPSNLSVDFDRLIKARAELRESLPSTPMEVLKVVNNLEPEQAKQNYEAAVRRIWEETDYTGDLLRAEILGLAIDSFARGKIEQVDLKWEPSLKGANFDRALNVLYAGGKPPGPDKFLLTLGSRGVLPAPADAIKQEMIRTYPERQNASIVGELAEVAKTNENLRMLMQEEGFLVDSRDRSLVEVSSDSDEVLPTVAQARRQERQRVSKRLDELNDPDAVPTQKGSLTAAGDKSLVDVLANRTLGANAPEAKSGLTFVNEFIKENPEVNPEKLTYTVIAVDQLQALGIPATTICEILKDPGVWCEMTDELDQKRWVYKGVQDIIDGRAAGLGLDELDVQGLVDADRMERQIERYHVMKIFQEVLINT